MMNDGTENSNSSMGKIVMDLAADIVMFAQRFPPCPAIELPSMLCTPYAQIQWEAYRAHSSYSVPLSPIKTRLWEEAWRRDGPHG